MRGIYIFLGIVAVSVVFCYWLPFVALPGQGRAFALPVISVPGEILWADTPVEGFNITNTIIGTLIADALVLVFALSATRNLKDVPGRLQGLFEALTEGLYSVARSTAGARAPKVFPMVATIFLFLLFANWMELVPGVDSIGLMHCAEDGFSGYPKNGVFLEVDEALNAGERATHEDYEACHNKDHAEESAGGEADSESSTEGAPEATGLEAQADPEVRDDIYVVTPFVRAAATDLNLTMSLALIAVLFVQALGIRENGVKYFAKFINTPALENAGKNPMGIMDFAVGFLEIISEISRIISFGFRLFGNIFAGQVLLFVIPFLAGALLPLGIYGFELFVGLIQAFVFGMLFLVFATMAMEGHHGDDDHHE